MTTKEVSYRPLNDKVVMIEFKNNTEKAYLGRVKILSRGNISFEPKATLSSYTSKILKTPKGRKENAEWLARCISENVIRWSDEAENFSQDWIKNGMTGAVLVPQWMRDLKREMAVWLVEDGTIEKMMQEMLAMANCTWVDAQ
jgi:hypothetical protein